MELCCDCSVKPNVSAIQYSFAISYSHHADSHNFKFPTAKARLVKKY